MCFYVSFMCFYVYCVYDFIINSVCYLAFISIIHVLYWFLRATARSAKRVLAIVILPVRPSVCLSDTSRYRFKPWWDRDSGFLPYDSAESLVCCDQISCRWVRRWRHVQVSFWEIVILSLLTRLAWERLQINTELLLLTTFSGVPTSMI